MAQAEERGTSGGTPKKVRRRMCSRTPPRPCAEKDSPGPTTLAELFGWPRDLFGRMSPELFTEFLKIWQEGFDVRTEFSGIGAAEMAFFAIAEYLASSGFALGGPHMVSACDSDRLCRAALMQHPDQIKHDHLFKDVAAWLPQDARSALEQMQQDAQADLQRRLDRGDAKQPAVSAVTHSLLSKMVATAAAAWRGMDSHTSQSWCSTHGRCCAMKSGVTAAASRRLQVGVAGTPFVDWTPLGSQQGVFGSTMIPFVAWCAQKLDAGTT